MRETLEAVLAAMDLAGVGLVMDEDEASARDAAPGVVVRLPEALRLALEAFTDGAVASDEPGPDTPARLVRDHPEVYGLDADPDPTDVSDVIRGWLIDDPQAGVVLLTRATRAMEPYRFPPEEGEDADALWVFRILTPASLPGFWWTVVDPSGVEAPYAYGYA